MTGWLVHTFSPFYDHGRRWINIKPARVDELIAVHAVASLDAVGVLVITEPGALGGVSHTYSPPKHLHRRKVATWVREFNRRAGHLP